MGRPCVRAGGLGKGSIAYLGQPEIIQFLGGQDVDFVRRGQKRGLHEARVDPHLDQIGHHLTLAALDILDGKEGR